MRQETLMVVSLKLRLQRSKPEYFTSSYIEQAASKTQKTGGNFLVRRVLLSGVASHNTQFSNGLQELL